MVPAHLLVVFLQCWDTTVAEKKEESWTHSWNWAMQVDTQRTDSWKRGNTHRLSDRVIQIVWVELKNTNKLHQFKVAHEIELEDVSEYAPFQWPWPLSSLSCTIVSLLLVSFSVPFLSFSSLFFSIPATSPPRRWKQWFKWQQTHRS